MEQYSSEGSKVFIYYNTCRYDDVIHLKSNVINSNSFKFNTDDREKEVNDVLVADAKIQVCWSGHPHLIIIESE